MLAVIFEREKNLNTLTTKRFAMFFFRFEDQMSCFAVFYFGLMRISSFLRTLYSFCLLSADMNQLAKFVRQSRPIRSCLIIRYSSGNGSSTENSGQNEGEGENKENSEVNSAIRIHDVLGNLNELNILNQQIPSVPTNCCMSGCANCVWIKYAEELSGKLNDGSEQARQIIMKEVQDPNMRAFLEMELRNLQRNKSQWYRLINK